MGVSVKKEGDEPDIFRRQLGVFIPAILFFGLQNPFAVTLRFVYPVFFAGSDAYGDGFCRTLPGKPFLYRFEKFCVDKPVRGNDMVSFEVVLVAFEVGNGSTRFRNE